MIPTPTTTSAPPDLDAIRQAFERLRNAREGYLRSERRCEDVRPIGEAVAALLALDVPAVVAALMDEAKGERYVAGCERADRLAAEARVKEVEDLAAVYDSDKNLPRHFMRVVAERNAERIRADSLADSMIYEKRRADAAEARVKELETRTAEDHDAICRQAQRLRELSQPGYADAVRRYEFANARAEAAEALADLAEGKCVRLERDLTEAKEQRDDALIRAEKAEALEREHEQARKA